MKSHFLYKKVKKLFDQRGEKLQKLLSFIYSLFSFIYAKRPIRSNPACAKVPSFCQFCDSASSATAASSSLRGSRYLFAKKQRDAMHPFAFWQARTPACAQTPSFRKFCGSASSATDASVSLRGSNFLPHYEKRKKEALLPSFFFGADYGARTRHLRLGKATLYQMS